MMTPTSSLPPRCITTTVCAYGASSNPWFATSTVTRSPCSALAAWESHSAAAPRRSAVKSCRCVRVILAMAPLPSRLMTPTLGMERQAGSALAHLVRDEAVLDEPQVLVAHQADAGRVVLVFAFPVERRGLLHLEAALEGAGRGLAGLG